ncbi:MAG: FAD-binding protein [Anaerolineales bacterium]|nr:FAD-binding protein [Anaerolineales bacterium]
MKESMLSTANLKEFERIVGRENVLTSPEDLVAFSYDGTSVEHRPEAVVLPESTEQVSRVMQICAREKIAVTPRGMGSGLAAAAVPVTGGISLCLTRMNRVLNLDTANMIAWVEAGVVTADLQTQVEALELFYPPDPSSIKHSTIGGNVACNAGGPRCLKYGVTGDYVMGLTVVLADGRVIHTGGKVIKNVTAYDLNSLFIGSEGTLGVVTQVLLKLIPKPKFARTAMAVYPKLESASATVNAVLLAGILPATMELMDDTTIGTLEEYLHLGLPTDAAAILIIEADGGDEATIAQEIETIAQVCRASGASDVRVAATETERNDLWRGRRSVSPSLARRRPNKLGEDISVPRAAIPDAIRRIKSVSQEYNLPIAVFGHAGDGNLHPNILYDKRDADETRRVEQASQAIFRIAVELGGTLSGEHGVGVLKLPYLEMAVEPVAIELMRGLKRVLDPQGILNPGKKFPTA